MKIAKVNRIKTAVGMNKGKKSIGFLYTDPSREESSADIDEIVRKRCDAAKRLYNVFDERMLKGDVSKEVKTLVQIFNAGIRSLKKGNDDTPERITESLDVSVLKDALNKANIHNDRFDETVVQEALDSQLKKCFRTPEIKSALRSLMVCLYTEGTQDLSSEDCRLLKDRFITRLVADYSKSRIKKLIPRSIRNKAMPVQAKADGGKEVIALSVSEAMSAKKKASKDAINSFLSQYAVLNDTERHLLRIRLRRLVNLYFYGIEEVCTNDFDEWKDHEERRKISTPFADVINKIGEKDGKSKTVIDTDATYETFRRKNIERFRYCTEKCREAESQGDKTNPFFSDPAMNDYWIKHIEDEVEKLYSGLKKNTDDFRFTVGYISEKAWKGIINFLSVKYISIGKAVYNFVLNGISGSGDTPDPGKTIKETLTSFDYEDIKAEETLQREIAVNVAFAANYLSSATMDMERANSEIKNAGGTDMLTFSKEQIGKYAKEGIVRNIMQFFGGLSRWEGFRFGSFFEDDADFLYGIKNIVYSLRNSSFHFTTEMKDAGEWDRNLVFEMFKRDCKNLGDIRKGKFYSNNLPMFYGEQSLGRVMDRLYDRQYERASQVPSFNTVFTRSKFAEELCGYGINPVFTDVETKNIWLSALYFLYKEIYYNGFLQDKLSLGRFVRFADKLPVEYDNKNRVSKDSKPADDFKKAIKEYKRHSGSLAEICQYIMTEHNRQNSGVRKKKSDYEVSRKPPIYQHYKMLLLKCLRDSFLDYLKDNSDVFGFAESPALTVRTMPEMKDFLRSYVSKETYDIISMAEKDPYLLKWYVTARLLNPKQVNQLVGSFRSYKQYVADIRRRASETGNKLTDKETGKQIDNVLKVLEIVAALSGATSNVLEDYFRDKDEYAEFLSNFVDFGADKDEKFPSSALAMFCGEEIQGHAIGIFHDDANPILNRNVIFCKLYGAANIIPKAVNRLTKKDIADYYALEEDIREYRENGECTDADQQGSLRRYQGMKNRVELRNIAEYSEILNELQGQLINWAYLRERDLMYFQLGFHYVCMNNESVKPEGYAVIKAGDRTVNGAILYQIAAMYTCALPLYYKDASETYVALPFKKDSKKGRTDNSDVSIGDKITYFLEYSRIIREINVELSPAELYLGGMELFENISEHDDCTDLRNYIEHFKYFSQIKDRSMLDIYSEVFDRFFSYDSKYRKNVINMLSNILLGHCVKLEFDFATGEKAMCRGKETKARATIELHEYNGISSDKYTFNIKDGKGSSREIKLCAKGTRFLKDVASLLCYPAEFPNEGVRDSDEEDEKTLERYHRYSNREFVPKTQIKSKKGNGNPNKSYNRSRKNNTSNEHDRSSDRRNENIGTNLGDLFNKLKR